MRFSMIKPTLCIILFCMLTSSCTAVQQGNSPIEERITLATLDEGGGQSLQKENIQYSYSYNVTENTRNFYFLEVFAYAESVTLFRSISPYSPCQRVSEYAVMGRDVRKSESELKEYSYLSFLFNVQDGFKWKSFKLTDEITAYKDKDGVGYIKFTFDGCVYSITGGTEEDCLDLLNRFSGFFGLEEVRVRYGDGNPWPDGMPLSIEAIFVKDSYQYILRTIFAEDLDGYVALLTAMQAEQPDDNDFTQSLIAFIGEQCRVPVLLPVGYGPFTDSRD